MQSLSVRQITGYGLLAMSCVAWVILPAIPFLGLSASQKVAWAGGVFLFAEITWWSAMPLLGPEAVHLSKSLWKKVRAMLNEEINGDAPGYLSFIDQTLHYFGRPHEHPCLERVNNDAAWRGSELPSLDEMAYHLSPAEVAEISAAVALAAEKPGDTRSLTADDFPLPLLAPAIADWREQLSRGRGFQVIRGVPVALWTQAESELFFWCFGLHLGRPGEQNPDGDLLGHVIDTSAQQPDEVQRLYKTAANIDYHCDAADVVGLLCLHKAKTGGQSRIVSSVTVFNELLSRAPKLVPRLFQPFALDIRDREVNEAGSSLPIQPCCWADGVLRTFYHADYFRSAVRHSDVPPLTEEEQRLLDTYEAIASEEGVYLDMDLQPGDIQLLSNHTNLHARTAYEDHAEADRRRHLLRLWLSL